MKKEPPLIMVVEDQYAVRQVICRRLEAEGYRVIGAEHGGKALEVMRLKKGEIKAIVLDQEMTEWEGEPPAKKDSAMRDGDEFIKAALEEGHKLPFIIVNSASIESFCQWMHDLLGIERKDYMKRVKREGEWSEEIITELEFENEENGLHVATVDKTAKGALDRLVSLLETHGVSVEPKPEDVMQAPAELPEGLNKKHPKKKGRRKG